MKGIVRSQRWRVCFVQFTRWRHQSDIRQRCMVQNPFGQHHQTAAPVAKSAVFGCILFDVAWALGLGIGAPGVRRPRFIKRPKPPAALPRAVPVERGILSGTSWRLWQYSERSEHDEIADWSRYRISSGTLTKTTPKASTSQPAAADEMGRIANEPRRSALRDWRITGVSGSPNRPD